MKQIAFLLGTAAALASATSVVGLEAGNIPMPRRRPRLTEPTLTTADFAWLEQRELQQMGALHKIDAAKAKRARKAEKLKAVAAKGGIETVPVPTATDPGPIKIAVKEPVKVKRSKKTTT